MTASHKNLGIALGFALVVVGIDQWVKRLVVSRFLPDESHAVIPGLLDLSYRQNHGAAFSIMASAPSVALIVLNVLVLGIFIALIYPHLHRRSGVVAAVLVLGGALGNLIDRLARGYVVDYIDVHVWPVFNIADITIVLGVIALLGAMLVSHRKQAAMPENSAS